MNHDVKRLGKAQFVQDVEELVGRQGANRADRIGPCKESVGSPSATVAVELGAIAGQGHDAAIGSAVFAHRRTMKHGRRLVHDWHVLA